MKVDWWRYRAEGNAHILLEYHGGNSAKDDQPDIYHGRLLRLKKASATRVSNTYHSSHEISTIISKLIPEQCRFSDTVVNQTVLPVERRFLEEVCRHIYPSRPEHRRKNSSVDYHQPHAQLVPDFTRITRQPKGRCISIEIKPKWGYIPSGRFRNALKTERCRYCMHQYFKLHKQQIESINRFCPLDLYCGKEDRQVEAIRRLLECPQNNFSAFYDGNRIGALRDICVEFFNFNSDSDLAVLLVRALNRSAILPKIRHHQKQLDPLGIEEIYLKFSLLNEEKRKELELKLLSPETWKSVVEEAYQQNQLQNTDDDLIMITRFLVSKVLKDLSILITFKSVEDDATGADILFSDNGAKFQTQVRVVDLDPKPLSNIPKYYQLDQAIVEHYRNLVSSGSIQHFPCFTKSFE